MKKILMIFVLAIATASLALAQTVQVRGTVTSAEDGLGIPGVMISVKGTTVGVMTDVDGNYTLSVPANSKILVFSYVGMKKAEVDISGKEVVDVVMQPDLQLMDEIVVVGYGVQKKSDVTGAIASVKGDAIATLATPSFDVQLAGRSAGVQVTTQSGILGEAPRMRIRGIASISNDTYPLVVVDGVSIFTGNQGGQATTNALADINPADIESMEILKDGSATAIYGSKAANGVILITTKKGSRDAGKYRLSYNTYFGVAQPIRLFDLLNAEEFILISNEKRANRSQSAIAETGTTHAAVETDWQNEVLRQNAFQMDHTLSLSGATERTNYYFSLNYSDQEGVAKPNMMERFAVRANVDQKVAKWLDVGVSAGVTRTKYLSLNTGTNALSGNIFSAIRQHPNVPILDEDDPTGYNIDDASPDYVGRWNNSITIGDNLPNIMYVIDNNKYMSRVARVIANTYAQVNFTPWLFYKLQLGTDFSQTDGYLYWNPVHGDGRGYNGYVSQNFNSALRWNLQNIITMTKTFADNHNLGLTLINEYEFTNTYNFSGTGRDLTNVYFNENLVTNSTGIMSIGGGMTDNGFTSYAARATYNYAGKYFLQGSVRYDGISSLPTANKYGVFPGASVGWTVSKENFFSGITSVVNDLKVRASYAKVGNTGIGNYPYQGLYSPTKYGPYNAIAYSQFANPDLQWESSTKYDAGFDAQFMEGRFGLTFDYYLNMIDNMILDEPKAPSLGIPGDAIKKNVGSMKNWGYEFSANAWLIRKKDFTWQIDANLTLAGNEVLTLVNHQDMTYTYNLVRENEPLNVIFGYKYYGVNMTNGNPVYYKADGSLVQVSYISGTFVYDPSNPSAMTTAATLGGSDKQILGSSLPTYYGGLNTKFTYKGLDLNIMLRYSGGNVVMNRTRVDLLNQNFTNNGAEILNRWQSVDEPGDGWIPRLYYGGSNTLFRPETSNSMFVEKGNFIKVSNIQLGYNLPKALISKVNIENMRVYIQGQDLFMFTPYTGIDPEMETGGVDFNGTPRQRIITGGISITL